jgi:uncharacterized protein (DUF362 family)
MIDFEKRTVFVTHVTHEVAEYSLERAINFLSDQLNMPIKSICIKVNLCDYRTAESGATTDPALLEAFVNMLHKKYKPNAIFVIENNATAVEANSLFKLLGFREIADRCNIQLLNVAEAEWTKRPVNNGLIFKELDVPTVWEEADLRVNFAKLKTNSLTKTTGCLKNLFGLLREKRKSIYHNVIDNVIADINQVMVSDFCLVDGLIGQEGLGPAFGTPKRCELLVAGIDPVAVDSCCARIMGFNPRFIKHIMNCHEREIGNKDYLLETDIQNFSYKAYKFKYSRLEHLIRIFLRKFFHLGAVG